MSSLHRRSMSVSSALAFALAVVGTAAANAGFTYFQGSLPPPGASSSTLMDGRRSSRPVGFAVVGGAIHAGQWRWTNNDPSNFVWVDLNPDGASESRAFATHGARKVGYATFGGVDNAVFWRNYTGAWNNLNPAGATSSRALDYNVGASSERTVGWADIAGVRRAGMWTGSTADTWVDLHPLLATASEAHAAYNNRQGGWASIGGVTHAAAWSGSAASFVDLNPAGASQSMVLGLNNERQVGWAEINGVMRAGFWSGTAASWVDLHPTGATASAAYDARRWGGQQVGWAEFDGVRHAARWNSTRATYFDLHSFLPDHFSSSEAFGTWSINKDKYYVGQGFNTLTGQMEALLWAVPTPGAASLLGLAALTGLRRRR